MAYQRMTDEERDAFLRDPVRPGLLATTRPDGRPHVAPIWYALDGDTVVFNTGVDTVKGRNLAANGRAAMCVQDDQPPFSFVTVEGQVEIVDDLAEVRRWAAAIGGRYMGANRAEEYGDRNGVPGELVVRLPIDHSTAVRDVAD
jgi:PPOX class probable F420-dependent enzyme